MRPTLRERFEANVRRDPAGCWLWTGYTNAPDGYGRIYANGKYVLAHRLAWEFAHGEPAPAGIEVRHTCDVPLCVNPAHLVLGTHAENMADMTERDRQAKNTRNARTKLTPEVVREIRAADATQRELAARYGVSKGTIQTILERRSWAYVDDHDPITFAHAESPMTFRHAVSRIQ